MKYNRIQSMNDEGFRRLTGVKHKTFNRMIEILKEADAQKKKYGGRKNKLSIEDQLLLSLEYLREDRKNNQQLSSQRVLNENVISVLKRFAIISDRYRNRRKRFGLRFNIISGI